jgi:hypothetical protein
MMETETVPKMADTSYWHSWSPHKISLFKLLWNNVPSPFVDLLSFKWKLQMSEIILSCCYLYSCFCRECARSLLNNSVMFWKNPSFISGCNSKGIMISLYHSGNLTAFGNLEPTQKVAIAEIWIKTVVQKIVLLVFQISVLCIEDSWLLWRWHYGRDTNM